MVEAELVLVPDDARVAARADSDAQMVALWLDGRSPHTQRAYAADAGRFLRFVGKPLPQVAQPDVQAYADSLAGLAPNTRRRHLAVVRSLLTRAQRIGYLRINVGAALLPTRAKQTLAQRILPEADVQRLLALETHRRNRVLMQVLYGAAARVSEVCGLCWGDVQERGEGLLVAFRGKGRQRAVLLPAALSADLLALREGAGPGTPVFQSRRGGPLTPMHVVRIVRHAAERAGIEGRVSPHWLRHAYAIHALERGVPIHLVQATLGHASVSTTGQYLHARPQDRSSLYLPL